MIKEKDVLRMKVPFPNISSGLAVQSHMYICSKSNGNSFGFVKVQTLKPYMINSDIIQHYVDEKANPMRNPFRHSSRIDCDKFIHVIKCYIWRWSQNIFPS